MLSISIMIIAFSLKASQRCMPQFFSQRLYCSLNIRFLILIPSNLSIKTRLNNGVRVYRDEHVVTLLAHLISKNLFIW